MTERSSFETEETPDLRVVFVGNRDFSRHVLDAVIEEHAVVGVVGPDTATNTAPPGYESLHQLAARYDIPVQPTTSVVTDETVEFIDRLDPTLCLCAGWTEIIPPSVLELPEEGFIGVHASSLPRGRGGAPVNWAIIRGADRVGVSIFELVSEVDDGAIFAQSSVPIEERDNVATVYDRVTAETCRVMTDVLDDIARGEAEPRRQNRGMATYRPQRIPEDGLIDWSRSAEELNDWVRALTAPYPGAFTFVDGHRVTIWSAEPISGIDGTPGTVTAVEEGSGVFVATGEGALRLERIQSDHRPPGWADERAATLGLREGIRMGQPPDFPDWLYTGIRDESGGFDFRTNVSVGETVSLTAVACSHASERLVTFHVAVDGECHLKRERSVRGWVSVPLEFTPTNSGVHTIRVEFSAPNHEDVRYLKIFTAAADQPA